MIVGRLRVSVWARGPKRLFDMALTSCMIAVAFPFMVLIGASVWTFLGTPVLFRQGRVGYRGRPFKILKFRTMRDAYGPDGRLLPDEQRMTPVGSFLRRTSLDELPELWNVLRGDMSLVGPRPLLPDYLPYYTEDQALRHDLRPGLTGWAQVNGRNTQTWAERFACDLHYIRNCSFLLDVKIILRTIWKITGLGEAAAENRATMPRFDDEVRAGRAVGNLPEADGTRGK
jgi:lipopolysaccharide/colanic/teichoic acid biosynthesis glycosyltransferase